MCVCVCVCMYVCVCVCAVCVYIYHIPACLQVFVDKFRGDADRMLALPVLDDAQCLERADDVIGRYADVVISYIMCECTRYTW